MPSVFKIFFYVVRYIYLFFFRLKLWIFKMAKTVKTFLKTFVLTIFKIKNLKQKKYKIYIFGNSNRF